MSTVFAEVECIVNSSPLGQPSNDANDLQPLTPNHLILGRATASTPQGPFREARTHRKRFEYIQSLVQQFWSRFQKEYLQTLMRRAKWKQKERQFKIGDIVLMVDENVSRGKWNLARVIEVFPGKDGVIRNVKLKTKSGEYKRSVHKCCPILEKILPDGGPEGCFEHLHKLIHLFIFYCACLVIFLDFLQSDWLQRRAAFYDILTAVQKCYFVATKFCLQSGI